jgi:AraC family transcriptional regulator
MKLLNFARSAPITAKFMALTMNNPYEVFANHISEYVQAHLDKKIAIDDLSALVGVSKYHLNRLFQATTGFQLGEFVQRRRLQHAYSLLSKRECSVIDACIAVGYESQSSFSRAFLKAFGCQPSEVKRGAVCAWKTPNTLKGSFIRDVEVEAEVLELPIQRLYGLYGAGFKDNSFVGLSATLINELGSRLRGFDVALSSFRYTGVSLESPWQGDQNESRFFVGVDGQSIKHQELMDPVMRNQLGLDEYRWCAGHWAKFLHRGSYAMMWQSISRIYAGWVIPEGVLLKDDAIVQVYLNSPKNAPETELCTALYFPLRT